jgi:hypothetical protein
MRTPLPLSGGRYTAGMRMHKLVWYTLAGSALTACLGVYLAAVGVNAQVEGAADWWPYPWLWALAALALASSVLWLYVANRGGVPSPEEKTVSHSGELPLGQPAGVGVSLPFSIHQGHQGDDHIPIPDDFEVKVRPRVGGDLEVVSVKFGSHVGVIQPRRDRYEAVNRYGSLGMFDTIDAAASALRDAD